MLSRYYMYILTCVREAKTNRTMGCKARWFSGTRIRLADLAVRGSKLHIVCSNLPVGSLSCLCFPLLFFLFGLDSASRSASSLPCVAALPCCSSCWWLWLICIANKKGEEVGVIGVGKLEDGVSSPHEVPGRFLGGHNRVQREETGLIKHTD